MKYAHIADCHIGSWRDPLLKDLAITAFEKAIDRCKEENVDFVLIAGDLFNTSFPPVDHLKRTVIKLRELKEADIPVYMIAGSHDYSPSGKTMLDVLENAGLAINVAKGEEQDGKLMLKFTIDKKTGAKITGILGKMGALEKSYFDNLLRKPLEEETGYKIFLFHALLTELKPESLKDVESYALSMLPKNFDYYAGGHPHFVYSKKHEDYGIISYTGPLFPNSFAELEELGHGGFYIIEEEKVDHVPIKLHGVRSMKIDCSHKTPDEVTELVEERIKNKDFTDDIVLIRLSGTLESGRPSEIRFRELYEHIREKGAYAILKNSSALSSKEFEEIRVDSTSTKELEEKLIAEHVKKERMGEKDTIDLTKDLLKTLDTEKQEGETVYNFEKRVKEEMERVV
jgi:hypothetical protein